MSGPTSQHHLSVDERRAGGRAATGDAAAIDAYLGKGRTFNEAMVRFAAAYARQNQRDDAQLVEAIRAGEVDSAPGW